MADFALFLPGLLQREGGWSDNPADPGRATNLGITLAEFSSCSQRLLGIPPTIANLRTLTMGQAGTIYRLQYWDACHGDEIECQDLASLFVDFAVNSFTRACKLFQSVINQLAMGSRIAEDGDIGPATIAALSTVNQSLAYGLYRAQRIESYQQIVAENPSMAWALKGWIDRVNSFPASASR